MMKKGILFIACLLSATLSFARQLTPSEAAARLAGTMRTGMHKAAGRADSLQLTYTAQHGDTALVYVMKNSQRLYVLSADDCAPALLGYTDGDVTVDSLPDQMKWLIQQYATGIAATIRSNASASSTHVVHDAIGPLVSTQWSQSTPYNNLCNDVATGCYTGCVATAMAQLMNYHQWPVTGTGSHSYTYNSVTISSDFSQHTYDWANMAQTYASFGNTDEGEAAVSLLMRDCGVSVDMQYSKSGSGTDASLVANAFTTYFGYDKAVRNYYRDFMTDSDWEQMLVDELAANRPVLYGGASVNEGGHAFICDGYDGNGYFHLNWGWNGYCDGNFLVTGTGALVPYSWTTSDDYGFTNTQMVIAGIQPTCGGSYQAGRLGLFDGFTISKTEMVRDSSFTYSCSYLANIGERDLTAKMGLMLRNTDTDEVYYYPSTSAAATYNVEKYYMQAYKVPGSTMPTNGTYEVLPVFKDMSQANPQWQQIELPTSFTVPTITITGALSDLCLADYPLVYSNKLHTPSNKVLKSDINIRLNVKVQNAVSAKKIEVYFYPEAGGNYVAYAYKSITSEAGKTLTLDLQPTLYSGSSFSTNTKYLVHVKVGSALLPPSSEYSEFYIQTVDEMPHLGQLNQKIKQLSGGTSTLDEVSVLVDDLLNLQEVTTGDISIGGGTDNFDARPQRQ